MIRSLYIKVFLWFCFVAFVVSATVFGVTLVIHSQSLGPRWMTGVLDMYARSALDFYLHGGKPGLTQYLDEIERSSRIRATLLDPEARDILGRGIPPAAKDVLEEARSSGETRFRTARHWRGASVVSTDQGNYILVAEILPSHGGNLRTPLIRLLVALLCTASLCLFLARHITVPIRKLQTVAGRIADGDLSVRALPAISPRRDEIVDLARDFDKMADRIETLLQKQRELLGDVSHELRSPLTRLGVSLELLRRGENEGVDRMQADLDRLNSLIHEILTLTRLQAYAGPKADTTVNLRAVVEGVAEDARFEGKEQEKAVVIAHADDCWTTGDPSLLRSCVENVVRNAVHHTKPKTGVVIMLNFRRAIGLKSAEILVADEGEGVPPETLPLLFEPFYRVLDAANQNPDGSGLGLSIAQRVAVLHGGYITARNREQGGLEMLIRLPATGSPV